MTEHQQQKNLSYYCRLFSKIKVNKSKKRGEAPYKPILLLSVIDLISQDKIQNNDIYITNELISTFNRYWDILSPDSFNGGLALPFFHLKNDGFWKLQFSQQYDGGRPQTIPKLKEDVDYAILDQGLLSIDNDYRVLISQDFYEESPYAKPLREFHSQIILLPGERKNYPKLEAIQWHRQNIFRA
jgi:putative restriction endonuclease